MWGMVGAGEVNVGVVRGSERVGFVSRRRGVDVKMGKGKCAFVLDSVGLRERNTGGGVFVRGKTARRGSVSMEPPL